MKTLIALPLTLGIVLAAPAPGYAALGASAPHHHHRAHYRGFVARAQLAPVAPTPSALELEGLTRNPDDCAKYGCIGNN